MRTRDVAMATPFRLRATLLACRRGGGDPTWRDEGEAVWKAWCTPAGPVTVRLVQDGGTVLAQAWGDGGEWLLERLPVLLGARDDDARFVPDHPLLAQAHRRHRGWRVLCTGMVVEALVPSILEQKVTGREAFGAYRMLVRRFGAPAPGPGADLGLWVAPSAAGWAAIPSWAWLQAGVDGSRSATVVRAVRRAGRLEQLTARTPEDAREALQVLPGVGVWTAAEVAHVAFGDADAVSFGDYHVPGEIGWALTGAEFDDAALEAYLRPYAGHRYRVQRLVELTGPHRPRRAPRRALPGHLPTPVRGW